VKCKCTALTGQALRRKVRGFVIAVWKGEEGERVVRSRRVGETVKVEIEVIDLAHDRSGVMRQRGSVFQLQSANALDVLDPGVALLDGSNFPVLLEGLRRQTPTKTARVTFKLESPAPSLRHLHNAILPYCLPHMVSDARIS